jgi:hypothetical protein
MKGDYCMKTFRTFHFLNYLAIIGLAFVSITCDNGNSPESTYENVSIIFPEINGNIETVNGGTFIKNGKTVTLTANVQGNNNPIQTVTWEITSTGHKNGTVINKNTGVLIIALDETHGTIITVNARSTMDTSKSDNVTVTTVSHLPSAFYGKWARVGFVPPDNMPTNISANLIIIIDTSITSLAWTAATNTSTYSPEIYTYGYTLKGISSNSPDTTSSLYLYFNEDESIFHGFGTTMNRQ